VRWLLCGETNGAAQAHVRAELPALGLTRLGQQTYVSSVSLHPDPVKSKDMRIRGLNERTGKIHPPTHVVIMRLVDKDESESIRRAQAAGQIIFFDLDDDVWNLPEWNPAYYALQRDGRPLHPEKFRPGGRGTDLTYTERNVRACDGILVTTQALKASVETHVENCPPVFVCRNGVDSQVYRPHRDHDPLRVGWMGTMGYGAIGLRDALPELRRALEPHGAEFWHLGADPGQPDITTLLGEDWPTPVKRVPWLPKDRVPEILEQIDIGIIARRPCLFTEAQSNVSGLCYAAAGIPFVVTPMTAEYYELRHQGAGARFEELPRLLKHEAIRQSYATYGERAVKQLYTPKIIAEGYVEAVNCVRESSRATLTTVDG
jgi:hypothetical protein